MYEMGKSYGLGAAHGANPSADDQSVAQTYLELYLTGQAAGDDCANAEDAGCDAGCAAGGAGCSQRIAWWWCDALFMGPAVWARMYAATGDRKYSAYLDEEWAKT